MVNGRKLTELMVYLGSHPKVNDLGQTKLWKLIYFIDAQALRNLGQTVTGSEFVKYEHGPVPSRGAKFLTRLVKSGDLTATQRQVGGKTLNELKAARQADSAAFSEEERRLIDAICADLGGKSAVALSDLSHKEPSWHYAEMLNKLSPELIAYGHQEDPDGL